MAVRILAPTAGKIAISPPEDYQSIFNRYADTLRSALISEENAKIQSKARALTNGEISFKEFKNFVYKIIGKYDEGSQRHADLIEITDTARKNDLRLRDLKLQTKLTERFMAGGLSNNELLSLHEQRLAFLRN